MDTKDPLICFNCESGSVTTTVEEHDVPHLNGRSFKATFPVHHCATCGESFLGEEAMQARHVAQRKYEDSLPRTAAAR